MRRHGKCLKLRLVKKRSRKRKVVKIAVETRGEQHGQDRTGPPTRYSSGKKLHHYFNL